MSAKYNKVNKYSHKQKQKQNIENELKNSLAKIVVFSLILIFLSINQ
jgi:hypothetical protein